MNSLNQLRRQEIPLGAARFLNIIRMPLNATHSHPGFSPSIGCPSASEFEGSNPSADQPGETEQLVIFSVEAADCS
jgi:hypothetical protein